VRTKLSLRPGRPARVFLAAFLLFAAPNLAANVLFYSGNLRTNATVTDCGTGCSLGAGDSDLSYAQWAAVVETFTVDSTTTMEAITYGFGGGTSLTGAIVSPGGLEPYLSLFDSGGNFLASTYFGTTCPAGANTAGGNCYDVALDGGTLTPGTYEIALTTFDNMSLVENGAGFNLSDGFTGLGNLAEGENLNYALDVVLPQNVPEPNSAALLLTIACIALFIRKKTMQSTR
jgi:hypothetical protein